MFAPRDEINGEGGLFGGGGRVPPPQEEIFEEPDVEAVGLFGGPAPNAGGGLFGGPAGPPGPLFGGPRNQQGLQLNPILAERRRRRGVNQKYLLKLRKDRKVKKTPFKGLSQKFEAKEAPEEKLNSIDHKSIQMKFFLKALQDLRTKRLNKTQKHHYEFGKVYMNNNYRIEETAPVEGAELPAAESNQKEGQEEPEKQAPQESQEDSLDRVFESRLESDKELIEKALKEEFVLDSQDGDGGDEVGIHGYLEHSYRVITALRVPVLNEDGQSQPEESDDRLIQTLHDLEVLFRELWNKDNKTRGECLTLLAYSHHLIELNQFWEDLTQFMAKTKENRGLKDILSTLLKESEDQQVKEAVISLLYDLQQRADKIYNFNGFLLKEIGEDLINLLGEQNWVSKDAFLDFIEVIKDIIMTLVAKVNPEFEDKNNTLKHRPFIINQDEDFINFLSQVIFWILSSTHRFSTEDKATPKSIIEELYSQEDQAVSGEEGEQSVQAASKEQKSAMKESSEAAENNETELIDSDWSETEDEEDINGFDDIYEIYEAPITNQQLFSLYYIISEILSLSLLKINNRTRVQREATLNLSKPLEEKDTLAAKFEAEFITLSENRRKESDSVFNQPLILEFLKEVRAVNNIRDSSYDPFMYSSKLLVIALSISIKSLSFEEKVSFFKDSLGKIPLDAFVRLFEVDEDFLVQVLEKEVYLDAKIYDLFEKFFFDRPICHEYEQVLVEYEKPKWKKREESYYKAIDILIKKISGGETRENLEKFLTIFLPQPPELIQDSVKSRELFLRLLKGVDILKNGNRIQLSNLTREDFVAFRPSKDHFITLKTIDLEDLSEITKTGKLELDEETSNVFKKASSSNLFSARRLWKIESRNSVSFIVQKSLSYEELNEIAQKGGRTLPPLLNQEEKFAVGENFILRYKFDDPGSLEFVSSYDFNGSQTSSSRLRTGLSFLTPKLKQDQSRARGLDQGGLFGQARMTSVYPLKGKYDPNGMLNTGEGLPFTHQIFSEKLSLRKKLEDPPQNARQMGGGLFGGTAAKKDPNYYGAYNQRFKKVILRADGLTTSLLNIQERYEFETKNEEEAVSSLAEIGTYDEIFEDLVVFSSLNSLSGAQKRYYTDFHVISRKKKLILSSKTHYSLLCFNLTRRKAKALHFSSNFTNGLNFLSYERDFEDKRIILDLDLLNLVLEKDRAPVVEYKQSQLHQYLTFPGTSKQPRPLVRGHLPGLVYLSQGKISQLRSQYFQKIDKGELSYHYNGMALPKQPENSGRGGLFGALKETTINLNQRTEFFDSIQGINFASFSYNLPNSPNWGYLNLEACKQEIELEKNRFIYISGVGGKAENQRNVVYRLRLPLYFKDGKLKDYRVFFSQVYGKLFILSFDLEYKYYELSTIRLEQLTQFIQSKAKQD